MVLLWGMRGLAVPSVRGGVHTPTCLPSTALMLGHCTPRRCLYCSSPSHALNACAIPLEAADVYGMKVVCKACISRFRLPDDIINIGMQAACAEAAAMQAAAADGAASVMDDTFFENITVQL